MLRTSLRSAQSLRGQALAVRPWSATRIAPRRFYASATPPKAPTVLKTAAAPAAQAALATKPKPKPGFFRKLRNYVLTLSLLGALGFGGGVWYARMDDTFHDLFTEYVPYGEQAVLYLEELEFQKKFPHSTLHAAAGQQPRDTGSTLRVPAQSGASWRVADADNSRQSAATSKKETKATAKAAAASSQSSALSGPAEPKVIAVQRAPAEDVIEDILSKKPTGPAAAAATTTAAAKTAVAQSTTAAAPAPFRPPEVDEPSRWPPASPIDPLAVPDAKEPVVQDIVHVLNDIITVINADRAADKYGATIGKAKQAVAQVGGKIRAMRSAAEAAAAAEVATRTDAFDQAAQDLVARVEDAMAVQEAQWRQAVDAERAAAQTRYEERLAVATAREQALSAAREANALREQAVQLTGQFADDLRARVEAERAGRLGRLAALQAEVAGLEQLTAGWTAVVDASERAQQLHVAVDAVRARLAASSGTPFVRELVAVKEIAGGDPVVDAAIAAIPPTAYQHGLPSPPALIDRFRRVAAAVRKAALLPADAGVASHASSYVLSKVLFARPADGAAPAADDRDVEAVLARTQALLEQGNLDAAAREVNGLTGWAKTLSRDWLAEVRKVLEVQQAIEVIDVEARLRSLQLEKSF